MTPRYDSKREIFLWFLTNANVMVVAVPRVIDHQLFQVHGVQLVYQPIFVGGSPRMVLRIDSPHPHPL